MATVQNNPDAGQAAACPPNWPPLTGCSFCRSLLSGFKQQRATKAELEESGVIRMRLGDALEVLEVDCPHVAWIKSTARMKDLANGSGRQELWANVGASPYEVYIELQQVGQPPTFDLRTPIRLVRRHDIPGHPGLGRIIDPEWIDERILRVWLNECMQEHGERCTKPLWSSSLEPSRPDWVVDTLLDCIVPFSEATRTYCALSYTWGQALQLKNTKRILSALQEPGSLCKEKLGRLIPQTIRDAFAVTRILDVRYIWVDSLCIVQDDAEALQTQLEQMHLIYADSVVCIVAEAGYGADAGIRGIRGASKPRSAGQTVDDIAHGEMITGFSPTMDDIPEMNNLGYHDRAWTFQEYMFAKRTLIFGEYDTHWNCTCVGWWSESVYPDPQIHDAFPVGERLYVAGRWMRSPVPNLNNLTMLVTAFNEKLLTFPEDAIRAFSGIQSVLHMIYEGGLVFGLPELCFEASLAWTGSVTRRKPSSAFSGDPLRDQLPSWSWIGWQGRVQFPCDAEMHIQYLWPHMGVGFLEPVTQWYTMSTPTGPRRAIRSKWHRYRQRAQDSGTALEGWSQEVLDPAQEAELRKQYREAFVVVPRVIPRHAYSTPLIDSQDGYPPLPYWYPLPLPDWSDKAPKLNEQTQYLYCITGRAFLQAGTPIVDEQCWEESNTVLLKDSQGLTAGVLFLPNKEEVAAVSSLPGTPGIELVAIAKGWTTKLPGQSSCEPPQLLVWEKDKRDCYFVLWIEWREGIAYRRAAGRVYAYVWDECSRGNEVELILG